MSCVSLFLHLWELHMNFIILHFTLNPHKIHIIKEILLVNYFLILLFPLKNWYFGSLYLYHLFQSFPLFSTNILSSFVSLLTPSSIRFHSARLWLTLFHRQKGTERTVSLPSLSIINSGHMEPRAQHEGDGTTVEAWKVVGFLRSHPISPRTLGSIIMGTEERRDEVTIRNEPRERKSLERS